MNRETNMLQWFVEEFRRSVWTLALPIVVLAVVFAVRGWDENTAEANRR